HSSAPVFIHCRRGADRTGVILACYRIEHDKWDNHEALREARGYGMSWYQLRLQRYVLAYRTKENSDSLLSGAGRARDSIRDRAEDAIDTVKQGTNAVLDRIRN